MQNINHISEELSKYISSCFSSVNEQNKHLSGAGATYLFEEKLKAYYNKKFAVSFCNATTALQTLCLALDLNNVEILTSPINWGGSISPFLLHGNILRFTSFDPVSLNLSLSDLPLAITQKTKAVLSIDYGNPVNSKAIKTFCQQNNLLYISDSAQSLGSFINHKPAGYYAYTTVLSFTAGKSVFAGEGGAVITDDKLIYEKLLWFSQHPSRQRAVFGLTDYNKYAPLNGRLNPLSAILLNESFQFSLDNLRKYQTRCFKLIKQLHKYNFIENNPHLQHPSSSTFFNFILQSKPGVSIEEINKFLVNANHPFTAISFNLDLIPFDTQFRKQFKGFFSCSSNLMQQKQLVRLNTRIRLLFNNSH